MSPYAEVLGETDALRLRKVWYTGSDQLDRGYALCFNRDAGTAASKDMSRASEVEKPTAANMRHFAGLVMNKPAGVGPCEVTIAMPNGAIVDGYTTEACTLDTTLLSVVAGSYYLGGVDEGAVIGRAFQTVDRSSTNGRVQLRLDGLDPEAPFVSGQILSPALWNDCPLMRYPELGFFLLDDFSVLDLAGDIWTATQAGSAGTWATSLVTPGVAIADAGDGDDGDGINVQRTGGPIVVPIANTKVWFEICIQTTNILDLDCFVGLSEADTAIIDTSANASAEHAGFQCVTGDAKLIGTNERAGSGETHATATHTFVASTDVLLGMRITGLTDIEFYVNGAEVAATVTAAKIPNGDIVPSIVWQSNDAAATHPIAQVKWLAYGQTRV